MKILIIFLAVSFGVSAQVLPSDAQRKGFFEIKAVNCVWEKPDPYQLAVNCPICAPITNPNSDPKAVSDMRFRRPGGGPQYLCGGLVKCVQGSPSGSVIYDGGSITKSIVCSSKLKGLCPSAQACADETWSDSLIEVIKDVRVEAAAAPGGSSGIQR